MYSRFVFLFIFLFSSCNAFEQLIDFKVNQDFLIRNNKLQAIFSFGEAIDETSNVTSINKDTHIANMRDRGVNDRWLVGLKDAFNLNKQLILRSLLL